MRANGHPDAHLYPLHVVYTEAEILAGHLNNQIASAGLLTQMAVQSLFSKKAAKAFEEQIKKLTDNG